MPIRIKDETANATVLTIDNNGNMAFGDGTPINSLTLNGYGIIDSEGYIVHGLGSSSVQPVSGVVVTGIGKTVWVATLPGVIPTAVVDTSFPSYYYSTLRSEPDGTNPQPVKGDLIADPFSAPLFAVAPLVGGFFVSCTAIVLDNTLIDPSSENFKPELQNLTIPYRWI